MEKQKIDFEKHYDLAVELLRAVLTESTMENEFDVDIYDFLRERSALPEGYIPYWEDEDDE